MKCKRKSRRFLSVCPFFRLEAVNEANQHNQIVFAQPPHPLHGPVEELRIDGFGIKELQRSHFKVVADPQELRHGGQGLARGNGLDVALVLAQVCTHLVLGDIFLQAQLGNAVPDVFCVHTAHLCL